MFGRPCLLKDTLSLAYDSDPSCVCPTHPYSKSTAYFHCLLNSMNPPKSHDSIIWWNLWLCLADSGLGETRLRCPTMSKPDRFGTSSLMNQTIWAGTYFIAETTKMIPNHSRSRPMLTVWRPRQSENKLTTSIWILKIIIVVSYRIFILFNEGPSWLASLAHATDTTQKDLRPIRDQLGIALHSMTKMYILVRMPTH